MKNVILLLVFVCLSAAAFAEEKILSDQELTVLRSDFKEYHYLMPDGQANLELRGEFKCTGGFNDDVSVLVVNQENYVRWLSHYDFTAEAKFDKKKEGKFTVPAKHAETYYVVFDNFFSSVSNKKIKFKLKLNSSRE
jgi:hypothetical protein